MTTQDLMDEFRATPDNSSMAKLHALIVERQKVVEAITKLEETLERGQKRLKQLDEDLIPDVLHNECGQDECTIRDLGIRVTVKEDVFANIPALSTIEKMRDPEEAAALQERRDKAMMWCEEHIPDVIKRKFEIQFTRDPEDQKLADKFERDLAQRKRPLPVLRSATVDPRTLSCTVRELLEAGHEVPRDLLGVYTKRVAKISQRK